MGNYQQKFIKNLQLGISATVVIIAGLIYGFHPSEILPAIFGFEVQDLELKNIFRAIMGLYLALGAFWIVAIRNPTHWRSATLINVIFMGGLAFGRAISTIFDGISFQFTIGLILESFMMFWGIYNLKKYKD